MLHRRDGARFPLGLMLGIHAKETLVFQSFRCLLVNSKRAVMCLLLMSGFHLATTMKAWLVECYRDGCPSGRFSYLHRGTLDLSVSDHWVLGHLPGHGPTPTIAQVCLAASSRKSLDGAKLLSFKDDGGHCVLGDLQCCRYVLVPFPRSVPRHNLVSEFYRQFLRPHGLVFALTCTVKYGTLYRQVCLSK
jgi:hypothetical protein